MSWYDQCYHKISAHLRAEANIDATIEMAVAKAGDCAVDAIASMGVKDNGDYQIFQQGAAIVAGLEKKRVMECKTLINFLDPSTIDNSGRAAVKQDLQTLPQIDKLDPLQLCRIIAKHVQKNLRTFYPLSPDINALVESFDASTNLFTRPGHCNSDEYATIQCDRVREKYSLASSILYNDIEHALSTQIGKLNLAQAIVSYGPLNKLSTKCTGHDGVQLLYALVCTRLPNMQTAKTSIKTELTVAAQMQFDMWDPCEVVDQLSHIVKQAEDMGEGRPKIIYEDCIGNIALALQFRVVALTSHIGHWGQCSDTKYAEDAVPLLQAFYADIKRAVLLFRQVSSFDSKTFWKGNARRTTATISPEARRIIDVRSKAYTAVSTSHWSTLDDDPKNETDGAANESEATALQATRDKKNGNSKVRHCQSATCPGRLKTDNGHQISPKFLQYVKEAKLCGMCYTECVKNKKDVQLVNGERFIYRSPDKAKKNKESSDSKLRKYANAAGKSVQKKMAEDYGLHIKEGVKFFDRRPVVKEADLFEAQEATVLNDDARKISEMANKVRSQETKIKQLEADMAAARSAHKNSSSSSPEDEMQSHLDRICRGDIDGKTTGMLAKQKVLAESQAALTAELASRGYTASN